MAEQQKDLYKLYNPRSAQNELPNPDEKFITEDDEEIENENNLNEDELDDDENTIEEETLTDDQIDALLKIPDEKLKEHGIDDPKQWKNYQRALTKAKQDWKKKEAEYVSKLQSPQDEKIAMLEKQIAELKSPKDQPKPLERPIRPSMPTMPKDFKLADISEEGTASYAYMQSKMEYDLKKAEYDEKLEVYNDAVRKVQQEATENALKTQRLSSEQQEIKRNMIAELQKRDLTPAEAQAAFEAALKPDFYDADLIANGWKAKMNKKVRTNGDNNRGKKKHSKEEKFAALGLGGGKVHIPDSNEFTPTKDTSSLYKIK